MKTLFYRQVYVEKIRGGKKPLWRARFKAGVFSWLAEVGGRNYVGAGNTADNAIKDLQKQFRNGEEHAKEACSHPSRQ